MVKVNKAIELLRRGQPVYAISVHELTYAGGQQHAQTWADLIFIDFEHHAFDVVGLTQFMRGLRDGGPTPSGHPTPAVITTLPANCMSREEVLYNAWQARHVLAAGAHGILHTHARDPEAVRAFVAVTRYPFQTIGCDRGLPEGRRGAGGEAAAAAIWGMSRREYVRKADPWPLNPEGEIMLGLKIEDRHCLAQADTIASTPGIAFAEWGPGDMGMSLGEPHAHDPPYSSQMDAARQTIKTACDRSGIAFAEWGPGDMGMSLGEPYHHHPPYASLIDAARKTVQTACHNAGIAFYGGSWPDPSMSEEQRVRFLIEDVGAKIMGAPSHAFAEHGRQLTGRVMPV